MVSKYLANQIQNSLKLSNPKSLLKMIIIVGCIYRLWIKDNYLVKHQLQSIVSADNAKNNVHAANHHPTSFGLLERFAFQYSKTARVIIGLIAKMQNYFQNVYIKLWKIGNAQQFLTDLTIETLRWLFAFFCFYYLSSRIELSIEIVQVKNVMVSGLIHHNTFNNTFHNSL